MLEAPKCNVRKQGKDNCECRLGGQGYDQKTLYKVIWTYLKVTCAL